MNSPTVTKILLIMVVSMWGLNVVMVKYLVDFFSPLLLTTVRVSIATLVLIPTVLLMEGKHRIPKGSLKYLLGLSFCSIYLHQVTLGYGIQLTTASTASLIVGTIPLLTSLLDYLICRETMGFRKMAGVLVGLSGVLLVIAGSGKQSWSFTFGRGEMLIFLAALGYAVGNLIVKKLSDSLSPLIITAHMHLLTGILLWLTVILWKEPVHLSLPQGSMFVLLFSSIGPTALATVGFNLGIKRIGASNTAIFLNGIPAASMIFAALFLGEKIHLYHVLGFIGIVTGIYLGSFEPRNRISGQVKGRAQDV